MSDEHDDTRLPARIVHDGDLMPDEDIDIGYTHPLFVQCFLPLRHTPANRMRWETTNGRVSLLVKAGEIYDPAPGRTWRQGFVPAGPKARIVFAYVNDYAYRHGSTIPLGKNLHRAMAEMGVKVGGPNAAQLVREVENIAAAHILLGVTDAAGRPHQEQPGPVARRLSPDRTCDARMSYWVEKDDRQGTLWQPEMQLSTEYYNALISRPPAPVNWSALVGLQSSPRAMDVFAWIAYRLHKPLAKPVVLHAATLHAMFGKDIKHQKHFWPEFLTALDEALKWYPDARVVPLNDGLKLSSSPPCLPRKPGSGAFLPGR